MTFEELMDRFGDTANLLIEEMRLGLPFDEGQCAALCSCLSDIAWLFRAHDALPKKLAWWLVELPPVIHASYGRLSEKDAAMARVGTRDILARMLSICMRGGPTTSLEQSANILLGDFLERSKNQGSDDVVGRLSTSCHVFIESLRRSDSFEQSLYDDMCTCLREVAESFRAEDSLPKELVYVLVCIDTLIEGHLDRFSAQDRYILIDRMIDAMDLTLAVCD